SVGPFAAVTSRFEVQPGDIVQIADSSGTFYHSPVITAVYPTIIVCTHTFDALDRPLYTYSYSTARFLHIEGVRVW
ncbi:MAG: amidase domain-containing protein, partial [Clostridia bacterium]|nr:amidase domain-containing protein [Clostridia bacterium]